MAQRYTENRQRILEGKLEKLFGEYAAMSLIIDLARILSEEKVTVRIHGDVTRFTYEDGETFYLEDEDIMMLCGIDSDTIQYVKEAISDESAGS